MYPEDFKKLREQRAKEWTEGFLDKKKKEDTEKDFFAQLYMYHHWVDGPDSLYNVAKFPKSLTCLETLRQLCKEYDVFLYEENYNIKKLFTEYKVYFNKEFNYVLEKERKSTSS